MKTKSSGKRVQAAVLSAVLVMAGSASVSPAFPTGQATSTELLLEYKMPEGQVLRYQGTDEMRETSDRMGETVESVVTSSGTDAFRSKGRKNGAHLLEVAIEDASLVISSPRGEIRPDLKPIIGRKFDMSLSPTGTKVDVSAAESITFTSVSGPRSVASGYKVFFPELPEKPIQEGGSWTTSSVTEEAAGPMTIRTEIQRVNTLAGYETVDGLNCLRVTTKITGRVSGSGNQQGADITVEGTIEGTAVWHFAPQEGQFVRLSSEVVSPMTVTVKRGQTLSMPTTQTQKKTIKLAGR